MLKLSTFNSIFSLSLIALLTSFCITALIAEDQQNYRPIQVTKNIYPLNNSAYLTSLKKIGGNTIKPMSTVNIDTSLSFLVPEMSFPLISEASTSMNKFIKPLFPSFNISNLMYHYIRNYMNSSDQLGKNLSVSVENFDRQMHEIIDAGYTSITYDDLINYIYNGISLPKNPILITFDDGYEDAYLNALPILSKYNLKGNFAVIINRIGVPYYLTLSEIKQIKASGHLIVSHSLTHPELDKLHSQEILNELRNSKKILDTILRQNTQALIYPYGRYNLNVEQIAKEVGYKLARTTNAGTLISRDNVFELPQVRMTNTSIIK